MAADKKLELVVEVDVAKRNASIKTINIGLSSTKRAALKAGRARKLIIIGAAGMSLPVVTGGTAAPMG